MFSNIQVYAISRAACDTLIRSGIQAMQHQDYVKALEQLEEARLQAETNKWHEQQFLALNNIGLTYYAMFDYGEALNFYLEAYTLAVRELEAKHEMIVLNNIAVLYSKEKNFVKATEYFERAYKISRENEAHTQTGFYAINLGIVCNKTAKLQQARAFLKEAVSLLQEHPRTLLDARGALAENYLLEENYAEAVSLAKMLLAEAEQLDHPENKLEMLVLLAKAYLAENNYEQAVLYARKAFHSHNSPENSLAIYEVLANIYQKSKAYDLALQAKDSILHLQAQLNHIKNGRAFENARVKFELQNYQHQLRLNQSRLHNERKLFYSLMAIAVLIAGFIGWGLYNRSVKHRQNRTIAEKGRKIAELELENQKSQKLLLEKQIKEQEALAMLEQERLKNEIESRNRKLSTKALHLSARNQLIEEIIEDLSKSKELAKDMDLLRHVKDLKQHLKPDKEWNSFVTHFEEVNSGFLNTLKEKHPSLTANDMRFIPYIFMNLSNKEISAMLNITTDACRKRKERISKKMELPENVDLYEYISRF
ncbi:tetratricopeptide repeat protein [Cesiribacter sp. SM1]|uniref:tetratricopeptide repeat protein n=1 Tax=Cesiribacter sp. SM1 TaxID=2861196 RepID=UPI001CD2A97B|nr:tetratricopeptide repeat protein [Cesiribacter sp. SM1]